MPKRPPRRYSVIIADRATGVVRRFTVRVRPALTLVGVVLALPVLIGLGARWATYDELADLRAAKAALEQETESYRAVTTELTAQISSLHAAIEDLSKRAALDPTSKRALEKLPAIVKTRAMGGGREVGGMDRLLPAALVTPENTFGLLRDLLTTLEDRLRLVGHGVERRRALAAATPSIWPTYGWLSAGYGRRPDPFTGEEGFHPALDISTDKGQPVFATADGVVESAAFSGAYGNLVVIRHGFGLSTRYGHLARFTVQAGDQVRRGQVIGYVGATGRATGAHLHYEVLVGGQPINPLRLLVAPQRAAN